MRILSVAIACLLVIGVSHADDVRASMKVPTNIPAQDLEQALKSFAQDRRLYLIYASQDIDTLHTNGAVGEFTADQTLTKLLDGTGLTYRRLDDKTITIVPAGRATALSSASAGQAPQGGGEDNDPAGKGDQKKSFWDSFRVAQVDSSRAVEAASVDKARQAENQQAEPRQPVELDQEIIVSARRRDERLLDVPVAVTALSGDVLDKNGVQSIEDAYGYVPNLYISNTGNSPQHGIMLRGVGVKSPLEPGVALILDGVYIPRNFWQTEFLELDRLEILRGPQGALFGRNTEGGVVNMVSKQPQQEWGGKVRLDYSSFATTKASVYLTGPLTDGLAFDVAAFSNHSDGYIRNVASGTSLETSNQGVRVGLKWNDGGPLNIIGHIDYVDDKEPSLNAESRAVGSTIPGNSPGEWQVSDDFDSYGRTTSFGVSLRADYRSSWADLSSISGYRQVTTKECVDSSFIVWPATAGAEAPQICPFSPGAVRGYGYPQSNQYRQQITSQEIRLASNQPGRLQWQGGIYGFNQDNNTYFITSRAGLPAFPSSDNLSSSVNNQNDYGAAVFGQATYKLLDRLELAAGIRWSHDAVSQRASLDQFYAGGSLAASNLAYSSEHQGNFSNVSPMGSLTYHVTEDVMTYATVSKGYKGGGFGPPPTTLVGAGAVVAYGSEVSTNYEVGTKVSLFNRRLLANVDVFQIDINNMQLSKNIILPNGSITSVTTNAGLARSKGFEAELSAQPLSGLTLNASAGYTDARFVDYQATPTINLAGRKLDYVPDWTLRAGAEFRAPVTGSINAIVGVDYTYIGRIYSWDSNASDPLTPVPIQSWTNLRAGLEADRWSIAGYVNNVFDQYNIYENLAVPVSAFYPKGYVPFYQRPSGPPRVFGVRGSYKF